MLAALIVSRRPEPPCGRAFHLETVEMAVERQIEIEPRLLAVSHDVQACGHLVVHGGHHGVVLQLGAIVGTELVQMLGRELEPAGKRITADDGGPEVDAC